MVPQVRLLLRTPRRGPEVHALGDVDAEATLSDVRYVARVRRETRDLLVAIHIVSRLNRKLAHRAVSDKRPHLSSKQK